MPTQPGSRLGFIAYTCTVAAVLLGGSVSSGAPVTAHQAERAAKRWLASDPRPLQAPMSQQLGQVTPYKGADAETAYYVVSLKPEGFIILPADDLTLPIICFSAHGTYDASDESSLGTLVSRDLNARRERAKSLQNDADKRHALPADVATARGKWKKLLEAEALELDLPEPTEQGLPGLSDVRVPPLVLSRWSQSTDCSQNCYNYYTPNYYPCGCVATAAAQLMRFHQHPTAAVGSPCFTTYVCDVSQTSCLRGGDGSGGPYAWANMVLDPGYPSCGVLTEAQRQAIGALCYDAGVAVRMNYCSGGSGADTLAIASALKSTFQYSNAVKGGNSTVNIGAGLTGMLNPNLDAGYPAILGIKRTDGGHAVVADGYGYQSSVLYHHLNMGWRGSYDAWYNLPNINSSPAYDTVYKCVYNVYVTGSGEIISGRVTHANGSPLAGVTVTAVRTGGGTYTDVTDSFGVYALPKVPANSSYTLTATASGHAFSNVNAATLKSSDYAFTSGNVWGANFSTFVAADLTGDGDVDGEDFGRFLLCMNGPDLPPAGTCPAGVNASFDGDSDVDQGDFAILQRCFSGNGVPAGACH